MKVRYVATIAIFSLLTVGVIAGCSTTPTAAPTSTQNQVSPAANPCAAKTDPCAAKSNPCAAKTNPCAAKN
jgi:hypothetical protein